MAYLYSIVDDASMGLQDRGYYDDNQSGRASFYQQGGGMGGGGLRGSGLGKMSMWSFTTWLIAINVAVFVADLLLSGGYRSTQPLFEIGYFSTSTAIYSGQVWRFVTFQFLHGGIWHLLMNMLVLFWFGPVAEQYLGSKRFLAYYLLCGIAGAGLYLLLSTLGNLFGDSPFLIPASPNTPLVGASAGIFGILMAAAFIQPNRIITLLLMFVIPVKMRVKTLAYGLVVLATFVVFTNGNNAGGEAGHLGGAALGALLIRKSHWLNFALLFSKSSSRRSSNPFSSSEAKPGFFESRRQKKSERLDLDVDKILAKVAAEGIQSLSASEKQTLERATKAQRRRDAG